MRTVFEPARRYSAPYFLNSALLRMSEAWGRTAHWRASPTNDPLTMAIAGRLGVPRHWVVPTLNCTTALKAAARLTPVRACPVMTFAATWNATTETGASLLDVDEDGWPSDAADVGVELWGRPYPHPCKILDAAHYAPCERHGVWLREGRCEWICYSFGPLKEVAAPVGGALVGPRAADALDYLHGGARLGDNSPTVLPGAVNGLLPTPLSHFVVAQMGHLAAWRAKRRAILRQYRAAFGETLAVDPETASGHLAVLRFRSVHTANTVKAALTAAGIEWRVHYRVPVDLPRAVDLSLRIVSIPCHLYLSTKSVERIIRRVQEA